MEDEAGILIPLQLGRVQAGAMVLTTSDRGHESLSRVDEVISSVGAKDSERPYVTLTFDDARAVTGAPSDLVMVRMSFS